MDMVRTLFCKYDGRPHRLLEAINLGEDEHGLWTGSLPGTRAQRADGTWVTIDHHRVRLFPRGQWWSALFNDEPHATRIYCDITMPPEFGVNSVTAVDLDLDVRLLRNGTVKVMDEDEFEAHQLLYSYPRPGNSHSPSHLQLDSRQHRHHRTLHHHLQDLPDKTQIPNPSRLKLPRVWRVVRLDACFLVGTIDSQPTPGTLDPESGGSA